MTPVLNSPAPAALPASAAADVYDALMTFPLRTWIEAPAAASRVEMLGLPREALRLVIRTGKRRGLLRTRRDPDRRGFAVMRVVETLPRPPAPAP